MKNVLDSDALVEPVRFDFARGSYVHVLREELDFVQAPPSPYRRAPLLGILLWALTAKVLSATSGEAYLEALREGLKSLRARWKKSSGQRRRHPGDSKVWQPAGDTLWLLDVSLDERHVAFIEKKVMDRTLQLCAYVYDLIPVEETHVSFETRASRERNAFHRYVELLTLAKGLLFLSRFTRRQFLDYCARNGLEPTQNSKVVYPPQEISILRFTQAGKIPKRALQFLEPGNTVLALANFSRRKNLKVLLQACSMLWKDRYGCRLVVVTPPSTHGDLTTILTAIWLKIRFPGRLLFLTEASDEFVNYLYSQVRVVCVPSLLEGFGLPLVEGAQHGCHLIASDRTALIEVGAALEAKLVDPFDAVAWSSEIRSALRRPSEGPRTCKEQPAIAEFVARMYEVGSVARRRDS